MDELHRLRKLPANKACANCGVVSATGHGAAVMTFGIFVCHGCKSAHQSFSHLCKSVSMSYWSLAEVAKLRDGGNERARASWMARCSSAARLSPGSPGPPPRSSFRSATSTSAGTERPPEPAKPRSPPPRPRARPNRRPRRPRARARRPRRPLAARAPAPPARRRGGSHAPAPAASRPAPAPAAVRPPAPVLASPRAPQAGCRARRRRARRCC